LRFSLVFQSLTHTTGQHVLEQLPPTRLQLGQQRLLLLDATGQRHPDLCHQHVLKLLVIAGIQQSRS
jgi:hypothetical protein